MEIEYCGDQRKICIKGFYNIWIIRLFRSIISIQNQIKIVDQLIELSW